MDGKCMSQFKSIFFQILFSTFCLFLLVSCGGLKTSDSETMQVNSTPENVGAGTTPPDIENQIPPVTNLPSGTAPAPAESGSYKAITGFSAPGSSDDPTFDYGTYKNFKSIYHPDAIAANGRLVNDPDRPGKKMYLIAGKQPGTINGSTALVPKLKIFLPPGTHSLHVSIFAYYDAHTQQAASYRFGQLPVLPYEQVGFSPSVIYDHTQTSNILKNLFLGHEWAARTSEGLNIIASPSAGGSIQGTSQNYYQTPSGGWLYIHILRAAGNAVMGIDTQVGVEASAYEDWYRSAKWDSDGNPF